MMHNFVVCGNRVSPNFVMSYTNRYVFINKQDEPMNDEDYGYEYSGHSNYSFYDIEVEAHFLREMNLESECYED